MIDIGELTTLMMIIVLCLFSLKVGYDLGKERITNSYIKELKQWIEQLKEARKQNND